MKEAENRKDGFRIGELSRMTGVKAGTIRFYEKCGFLAQVKRLPNGYRSFDVRHIYQVRVCRLVFGGFVNKRLRKISMGLIFAARDWDLEAYRKRAEEYLHAVEEDIAGTKRAVAAVFGRLWKGQGEDGAVEEGGCMPDEDGAAEESDRASEAVGGGQHSPQDPRNPQYSKKQAAALVGVTPEAIRNWERNGLLGETTPYRKRFYSAWAMERMYVIRLLLDNGYSMMAVRSFFAEFDAGNRQAAVSALTNPGESETLIYRADRYMETLRNTRRKAMELCGLADEMHL